MKLKEKNKIHNGFSIFFQMFRVWYNKRRIFGRRAGTLYHNFRDFYTSRARIGCSIVARNFDDRNEVRRSYV